MIDIPLTEAGRENRVSQTVRMQTGIESAHLISPQDGEDVSRALGHAIALCWSSLSQDAQQLVFETTVGSEGERIRQKLALFLHEKHAKTRAGLHAKAIPEPDSLGG